MTLRAHSIHVASAAFAALVAVVALVALALMIPDVTAVRAATKICDVMPERCRYEHDGRHYYWSPGHPMPAYNPTPSASAGNATSHAWGCNATDGAATGRSWGFANQAAASSRALSECAQRSTHGSCHVVSCSPSVPR